MRTRLSARLVSLAALLPLLALAVSGFGYSRYRCTFTGVAAEESCCPAEDAPDAPVVSAASCCDHESAEVVRPPAETAPTSTTFAALTPALISFVVLPPVLAARVPASVRATSALGPPSAPLVVLKQSFLI
jgi:hypothetical protein